jgi:hypothetical protein
VEVRRPATHSQKGIMELDELKARAKEALADAAAKREELNASAMKVSTAELKRRARRDIATARAERDRVNRMLGGIETRPGRVRFRSASAETRKSVTRLLAWASVVGGKGNGRVVSIEANGLPFRFRRESGKWKELATQAPNRRSGQVGARHRPGGCRTRRGPTA